MNSEMPNNHRGAKVFLKAFEGACQNRQDYGEKDTDYGNLMMLQGMAIETAIEIIAEDSTYPLRWADISYTFSIAYSLVLNQYQDEYAQYKGIQADHLFWKAHFQQLAEGMADRFVADVRNGTVVLNKYGS